MNFAAVAIAAALAAATNAASCDVTSILTSTDATNCASESGYTVTSLTTPSEGEMATMCSSTACQSMLTQLQSLTPSECTLGTFTLYSDLLTPLTNYCSSVTTATKETSKRSLSKMSCCSETADPPHEAYDHIGVMKKISCCSETAEPPRETTGHVGVMKKAGNANIYVTGSAVAKVGVIAYPDIYGLDSGRTKSDADALGKLGYTVVVVDLTDGDYFSDTDDLSGLQDWFRKYTFSEQLGPRIQDAVNYLKGEAGVEHIVSYGMCWGSWVGATQTTQADPVVLRHVSFHPTWIVENILKGNSAVDKLAASVKVPQLLMSAGDDPDFVKPNGTVDKIIKARTDIGAKSDVLLFADQNHGWVHRGNLSNPATKTAVMKAWNAAVTFFETN